MNLFLWNMYRFFLIYGSSWPIHLYRSYTLVGRSRWVQQHVIVFFRLDDELDSHITMVILIKSFIFLVILMCNVFCLNVICNVWDLISYVELNIGKFSKTKLSFTVKSIKSLTNQTLIRVWMVFVQQRIREILHYL